MKIYCNCDNCKRKIYLSAKAKSRQALANLWGRTFNINCPLCKLDGPVYINYVYAEATRKAAPIPGVLTGVLVGVIAGPLGMIIGGALGGVTGGGIRYSDIQEANFFNQHFI